LRFYNISGLHFTYDEFSAFFRTGFNNFDDLIRFGVMKPDTHPPGVQVFLNYYVKLVGDNEALVKLPFIIAGIFSIYLAYRVGKIWFNPTVGLIAAMFVSVLQYPITFSLMARPYSPGLFFSLAMVFFWTNLVFQKNSKRILNAVGFVLSATFLAYTHHFGLLLVGLAGASGIFLVKGKMLWRYIFYLFLVFVLYIPNIPVFLKQLGKGGVESWLSKPKSDFILNYLDYILHYSPLMVMLTITLLILSFVFNTKDQKENRIFKVLAIGWFLSTFIIAYLYSVYINAVLQFSVLIFVYPFLVIFFFSNFRDLVPKMKWGVVVVFLTVSIYTLISERQHFKVMYNMAYREILTTNQQIYDNLGAENVTSIIHMPQKILDFNSRKLSVDISKIQILDEIVELKEFDKFVSHISSPFLVMGWTSLNELEYLDIAQAYFPYIIQKHGRYKGNLYLLSKEHQSKKLNAKTIVFESVNRGEKFGPGWKNKPDVKLVREVQYPGDQVFFMNGGNEFSPVFSAQMDDLIDSHTNIISISVDGYFIEKPEEVDLVCEILLNDELIHWRAAAFSDFIGRTDARERVYLTLKLADMNLNQPGILLKTYIWNKGKENFYFDDFTVLVRKGNPYIYGLFEKIY
jgi:hypothetical protein